MNEENGIKIIRLTTGEDIIADCLIDTDSNIVLVNKPRLIMLESTGKKEQTMLLMTNWLPIDIIAEDFAEIKLSNVVTIMQPKSMIIEYYSNLFSESDLNFEETEAESEEDEDLELFESMTGLTNQKLTIH